MLALVLSHLPVGLDGESAGNGSTGLAAISIVSMIFGWLLVAGLWWFVFRDKARARRRERDEE